MFFLFFFFNDTATTEIYTLSLHDALPICAEVRRELSRQLAGFEGIRILVTHDPLEAIALADRLVVLEQGKVVQTGLPSEVTARPRSRFVADLAGVNLLRGTGKDDHIELDGGEVLAAPESGDGDVF